MFIWNEVRIFAPQNQSCMKKYHYFLWLFLFLFVSCEKENLLDRMEQIKQVGNANPTLALEMLDSIQLKVRSESEYVQKKYDLLNVRLHDKADVLATSDIVVRELVPYFEENGSKAEQQEVHYYAGSVYRDLHDTPRALDHFLKALEIGKESDGCDSIMLANTYSNLNHLYYRVQDYRNALPMAREECRLMTKQNRLNALAVLHVGAALTRLDSVESAKKTFQEALELLKNTPHSYSEEQVGLHLCIISHVSKCGKKPESVMIPSRRRRTGCCTLQIITCRWGNTTKRPGILILPYPAITMPWKMGRNCWVSMMVQSNYSICMGRQETSRKLTNMHTSL